MQVSNNAQYGLRNVVEKSLKALGLKFTRVDEGRDNEIMLILIEDEVGNK